MRNAMHSDQPGGARRHAAFPIGFVTVGRRLLIAGGGHETAAKIRQARAYDWKAIRVVAPHIDPAWQEAAAGDERFDFRAGSPAETDVQEADLVIEDCGDRAAAEILSGWCRSRRIPLNALDKPGLCDWYALSTFARGPLLLALSSGGHAPALVAVLRPWLEKTVGPGWQTAACLMAELRGRLPGGQARMDLLKKMARDPRFLALIEQDDREGMRTYIEYGLHSLRTDHTDAP